MSIRISMHLGAWSCIARSSGDSPLLFGYTAKKKNYSASL